MLLFFPLPLENFHFQQTFPARRHSYTKFLTRCFMLLKLRLTCKGRKNFFSLPAVSL